MNKYCRDQARDELWLMMGAGAAAGIAGGTFMIGVVTFQAGLAGVQAAVVSRIAQVYGVNLIPASGAGATAAAIIAMGGGQFLFEMGGMIAGWVPGIGQVVQPVIGATAVKVFGEVAITYFENIYPNKIYSQKTL
ncbi:hypothetical protein [Nostoc sp. FACHB-280]|uniref:hypothetical protein n=1 Tax=Nostoc sp. FACHB-280 TaxID=2692839 RepID=UPI00168B2753|nr:hypothetical protein [Nostoc sp. FACHB-280]MBD2498523.1 hypothetical protein [Nostoc sp. FACHB-280]